MSTHDEQVERVGNAIAAELKLNPKVRIEWWPEVERLARAAISAMGEAEPLEVTEAMVEAGARAMASGDLLNWENDDDWIHYTGDGESYDNRDWYRTLSEKCLIAVANATKGDN